MEKENILRKVVTFGEIMLRLSPSGNNRFFQNDQIQAIFAGSEANTAVSLANYGIDSMYITKVPDNPVGKSAVSALRYFGVDTSEIIYGGKRLGVYYLEKGASQRPSAVIYDREYSAFSLIEKEDFDWNHIFNQAGWFHWTGINPALSDNVLGICFDACRIAKENGVVVSCDLNYRKKLWDSEKAQTVMKKLMPYVDVCIANEEDAEKCLGVVIRNNDVDSGKLNRSSYEEAARRISNSYGCKHVAFTLRESYSASFNGWSAILYDSVQDKVFESKKYDIHIVDRVGGGDSFAAGIIYGFMSGKDNQDIIDFATAASCLKHTIEGDFNRVTVEEVDVLIQNGGSGRVLR